MANFDNDLTTSLPVHPTPSYMSQADGEVPTSPSLSDSGTRKRQNRDGINDRRTRHSTEGDEIFHHSYTSQISSTDTSVPDETYEILQKPDNQIEAHKITNNYLFGFKKWKGHVTARPLSERSDVVRELYDDIDKVKPVRVSTVRPTNLVYVVLFGWWLALIYLLVGALLFITYIGRAYLPFCWRMARYFIWPFGKFVHQIHLVPLAFVAEQSPTENGAIPTKDSGVHIGETSALLNHISPVTETESEKSVRVNHWNKQYWKKPQTIIWLILGCPFLLLAHGIVITISWLLVVTIPVAKLNIKTVQKILFIPPEQVQIGDSGIMNLDLTVLHSEILMFTHQSVNIYYYKYTVDGMNIILVNLLFFVVLALVLGYADPSNVYTSGFTKCILSLLAIIPLTYYIGMGIACIAAQTVLAVGAILNATFGSAVEIILYIIFLTQGLSKNKAGDDTKCYVELVKSAMAGTLLATMMLIPGMSMIAGGLKYRTQRFNPQSAGISSSLLFVSVAGIFAPTIFSKVYGTLRCQKCDFFNGTMGNASMGLQCSECEQSIFGIDGDTSLYDLHIKPLVYAVAIMLPISYIIGLVFTLKTHKSVLYESIPDDQPQGHHGTPHWSKLKSGIIMLCCATLISLCADLVTENIQPLLQVSGISEYFIGVTLLAVVPELPELVNGVQFALQNNVALGLEIGSSTAVQVCLVQIPLMVLINLIYPFNFYLVFNDIHLWAVIFSVIVMNYTFQDGKSDYFQGWILVGIYLVILAMYFFTPVPPDVRCTT